MKPSKKDTTYTPKIVLHQPDKELVAHWKQALGYQSLSLLNELAAPFRLILRGKQITIAEAPDNRQPPEAISAFLNRKGNPNKQEHLNFLSYMLGDTRNFCIYIDTLPQNEKKVWETILTNFFISDSEVYQLTGKRFIQPDRYFYNKDFSHKAIWFAKAEGRGEESRYFLSEFYYTLHPQLFAQLLPVFFPDACNPEGKLLDQLPSSETGSLHVFNGETNILLRWNMLNGLYIAGQMDTSKTRIKITALRKLSKAIGLTEFFPKHDDKDTCMMRSSFVLNTYAMTRHSLKTCPSSPEIAIKTLLKKALGNRSLLLPMLLPHVTGLRSLGMEESFCVELAFEAQQVISELQIGTWMPTSYFHTQMLLRSTRNMQMFPVYTYERMTLVNNKLSHEIYLNQLYHEISVPFANGLIYLFAAYGLLEIAYRDITTEDASDTSSLAYFRLTPLGAYFWGQSKTYDSSMTASLIEAKLFEMDENNLIIRAISDHNPYENILASMTVPIGGKRYRMTPASLLNGCQNIKDLEYRVSLFKQYICPQPPANWNAFFNELLQRRNRFSKLSDNQYTIYQLDPTDRELQRIVTTDPLIRKHSVRAEGFLLLVNSQNQTAVLNKLREYGYLL